MFWRGQFCSQSRLNYDRVMNRHDQLLPFNQCLFSSGRWFRFPFFPSHPPSSLSLSLWILLHCVSTNVPNHANPLTFKLSLDFFFFFFFLTAVHLESTFVKSNRMKRLRLQPSVCLVDLGDEPALVLLQLTVVPTSITWSLLAGHHSGAP